MSAASFAPLLHVLLAAAVLMAIGWEIQRRTRNAGIVDAIWAASMGGAALYYASVGEGCNLPRLLVAMLGGIWAARLSLFLLHRILHEAEDGRYAYLRAHWRDSQPKFFGFFMLQAGFTALFSVPFLIAASSHQGRFDVWIVLGILVWAGSLLGESLADRQLARFRADPANRGKTCRAGLWRYSRHPNYFFEWLHWFGWVFISMGSPWWWLSLLGPLLMGASLVWITGIPFTEAQSLRSRGEDYRRYQEETSMFFPWFPKGRDSGFGIRDSQAHAAATRQNRPPRPRVATRAAARTRRDAPTTNPQSRIPNPGLDMLIDLCERGYIPDSLTRLGIRRLCTQRLREECADDAEAAWARFRRLLEELRRSPVAIETAAANEQHYEVPARFFELCLGKRYKYSSCYYPRGTETLDEAEEAMLALYGERAELADGQRILELGCGWGSLTLWMAERYPNARITGVSNSNSQREHIMARARERGLGNVEIITCDVNQLELNEQFDRTVSIEMFEHMRNYATLLERISGWLKPGGKLFVHIFCHRELMYPFETEGEDNWMGRHFFTGGLMPAADTLLHFQQHLALEQQWRLSGRHYERTANHWLENQDRHRDAVLEVLTQTYGRDQAALWNQRWRMFWMACAELFGYRNGNEWLVGHYRFVRR